MNLIFPVILCKIFKVINKYIDIHVENTKNSINNIYIRIGHTVDLLGIIVVFIPPNRPYKTIYCY